MSNHTVKAIMLAALVMTAPGCITEPESELESAAVPGEIPVNFRVIKPKNRKWTTPSKGTVVRFNPVSLLWHVSPEADHSVRLSQDRRFSDEVISVNNLEYAMFNPHRKLDPGMWYWQYRPAGRKWLEIDSFRIEQDTPLYVTPGAPALLASIPSERPRVLVWRSGLEEFRSRAGTYEETGEIITQAEEYLDMEVTREEEAIPAFEGRNDRENRKIAIDVSKRVAYRAHGMVSALARAYMLTSDRRYANAGIRWILSLASWDPEGITRVSDFGDSGLMHAMALGYDSFYEYLSGENKVTLLKAIAERGSHFYGDWVNNKESRLLSNHVWQHILDRFFQTSLAVKGDLPEADQWLEYMYELWIARSPVLGYRDGAWSNGISYFRMNTLTTLNMTTTLGDLTGVDFLVDEWYDRNPEWMIFAWPPGGSADGFGNGAFKLGNLLYPEETKDPVFVSYPDLIARFTGNPYGAWYADKRMVVTGVKLASDPVDLPQARVFRETGVVYMNTDLAYTSKNLRLAMRSSPYGSYSHAHGEHNCFNLFYGGEPLFSNTDYRPAMGDSHYLADFKNTRGHNGILINDMGQPFGSEAYGWIPRFIHGDRISYVVGDATNAYSATDARELNIPGNPARNHTDAGLKRFRRHLELDDAGQNVIAQNTHATAKATLIASTPLQHRITDQFAVTPENWRRKKNPDGTLLEYENNWHYYATTEKRVRSIRFLAVIQVETVDGTLQFSDIKPSGDKGHFRVGDWLIHAELDSDRPALLKIKNRNGSAALCSSGPLITGGKEYSGTIPGSSKLVERIDGRTVFREEADVLPELIRMVSGMPLYETDHIQNSGSR